MKKLSKAQIRLLQLMQERDTSVTTFFHPPLSGGVTTTFLGEKDGEREAGFYYRTVRVLFDAGFLIESPLEDHRWGIVTNSNSYRYVLSLKAIEFLKEDSDARGF